MRFALDKVYGMTAGDVWWGISDVGWVVGHSLIVYGPLMAGCTSVFYEGKPELLEPLVEYGKLHLT